MNETKKPWWNHHPPVGFRLSAIDLAILAACVPATWGAWMLVGDHAMILPIVLGHFFLFCNVFRIPRKPELIWSGVFTLNVAAWIVADAFSWPRVLAIQTPVTVMVVLAAMLRNDYHGLGYAVIHALRKRTRPSS